MRLQSKKSDNSFFSPLILGVMALSLGYWLYLSQTTQMSISCDAIGYEYLGRLLKNSGWLPYFTTGPNREPLYPLLVMVSMHLASLTSIAYTKIMALFGVILLFASQILILVILRKFRVRLSICAIVMLYFALSPAMNNAAFSLYSEIAAFPLILLVVLANMKAYECIQHGRTKDALLSGISLGLVFLTITFVKGIFEFIFLVFLLFYLIKMSAHFFQGHKKMALNSLIIALAFCICYQTPLSAYKNLNKKYNNHYALTNRGSWALYASCARRAEKLDPQRLVTALAYIPGKGFCESIFGSDKCYFWGIETLDTFGLNKLNEVTQQTPPDLVDHQMMELSKDKILQNPFQFLLLMSFDSVKMFFWESTKIGFVTYPVWLEKLYDTRLLKDGWRAIISILSLSGYIYLLILFFKNFSQLLNFKENIDSKGIYSSLLFILLTSFITFYALFDTIPRFALPIASLQLITIGLLLEAITSSFNQRPLTNL